MLTVASRLEQNIFLSITAIDDCLQILDAVSQKSQKMTCKVEIPIIYLLHQVTYINTKLMIYLLSAVHCKYHAMSQKYHFAFICGSQHATLVLFSGTDHLGPPEAAVSAKGKQPRGSVSVTRPSRSKDRHKRARFHSLRSAVMERAAARLPSRSFLNKCGTVKWYYNNVLICFLLFLHANYH